MIAKILMIFSASIILTLGVLHLVYTSWGPKLTPRDPALQVSMSQVSLVITKETTMWRAAPERIVATGGQVVKPPYPEGDLWVATFRDPAGKVLGIWQQGTR